MESKTGLSTFLFSDIEGSTKLWEEKQEAMRAALGRHDAILRKAIESHGGRVVKQVGDSFHAAFARPSDAVAAVLDAQLALQTEAWEATGPLKVRMALHTGLAEERAGDFFGQPLNRCHRMLSAGHGGQVLLSVATQELARDHLPADASLKDLGEHRLKDLVRPEHIFQLVHPGLLAEFPALRSLAAFTHNLPIQVTSFI
ncbi:MAG: adenylate/guanylate cyclase domain-containing protein, partial [Methylocella sp.]